MAETRRVAIVGSARIPFTRGHTGYARETNLSMMSAALRGLIDRYNLVGEKIDEVVGGAVIAHSRDFNLVREAALDAGLSPRTPGTNLQIACGTSLQAALMLGAKIAIGEIDCGIAAGSDTVSDSPVVFGDKFQHRMISLSRARTGKENVARLQGLFARRTHTRSALDAGAAHWPVHGAALRVDGARVGDFPGGAGSAGLEEPPQCRPRLCRRLP